MKPTFFFVASFFHGLQQTLVFLRHVILNQAFSSYVGFDTWCLVNWLAGPTLICDESVDDFVAQRLLMFSFFQ